MKVLYASMVTALLIVITITTIFRGESDSFYGIAETKEIIINDDFATEIKNIYVVPGMHVQKGDTLCEIVRPELETRILYVQSTLDELNVQKKAHKTMSGLQVLDYQKQQQAKIVELTNQITGLQNQLQNNRNLVSELKSLKQESNSSDVNTSANSLTFKIQQLQEELKLVTDSSKTGIGKLSSELAYAGEPLAKRIEGLTNELLTLEEKKHAFKVASIDGLIGSINVKNGDNITPFSPIMSLHEQSPSFVQGYIHENVYSSVAIGQKVQLNSITNKQIVLAGEIAGVGSRIVEYPVRLRKYPELQMWGREVTIKIPDDNNLLLGEKVRITVDNGSIKKKLQIGDLFGHKVFAGEIDNKQNQLKRSDFEISPIKNKRSNFNVEASGLLFASDLGKYLLVSDETQHKQPTIFIMSKSYEIEKQVDISGIPALDDLESITQDKDGFVYVLSSNSYSKKGNLPEARTLLVKCKRSGDQFEKIAGISLKQFIENNMSIFPVDMKNYLQNALVDSTLDIEGMAFKNDTLLLGLKNPLLNNKSVILFLSNPDSIFSTKRIAPADAGIWKTISLLDSNTSTYNHISDLLMVKNNLYILATSDKKDRNGQLWELTIGTDSPSCKIRFSGKKPEGIAFNSDTRQYTITFDNGSKTPSEATTIGEDQL